MSAAMIWLTVGCALMLAEFIVPGFIIFFFGFCIDSDIHTS